MKIGILRPLLGVGGAEVTLVELALHLQALGHTVWMHFDSQQRDFNRYGRLQQRLGSAARCLFNSPQATQVQAACQALQTTDLAILVHRHGFSENLLRACQSVPRKWAYVPGINAHHVYGQTRSPRVQDDPLQPIQRYLFNSQYSLKTHQQRSYQGLEAHRCHWFHPPMLTQLYRRQDWMDQVRLEPGLFHIAAVGRLIPSKRPFELLDIFHQLLRLHRIQARLHFLGDGPLSWRVWWRHLRLGLLGKVKFHGMVHPPQPHLVAMDAILHGCRTESLSRALREGLMLGCPAVAYRGGGNPELLQGQLEECLFEQPQEAALKLAQLASDRDRLRQLASAAQVGMEGLEAGALERLQQALEGSSCEDC